MNEVLILGASGLLGRYVHAELSAAGLPASAQSRSPQHGIDHVFDPTVPAVLCQRLTEIRPDVIVNLTALTDVDSCNENLDEAYRVNTRIPETLAAWVTECHRECRIIQISTDQLYFRAGYQDETDIDLVNAYALTKYAGEIALRGVPKHTVMRTNFFGRSLTPGRTSFSDWIHESLILSRPIRLAVDIEFNPLSLPTLAHYIAAVIARPVRGVFNVGSRGALSKHAFGVRFAHALALPPGCIAACNAEELNFRVRRPLDMRMDVRRFEACEGPMPTFENEISRAARAYPVRHT
jgi:dTDP-4-dehydrorhamnose reductase